MKFTLSSHRALHARSRRPQDTLANRIANDPYVDWSIMFTLAVLVSLALIGLGYLAFISSRKYLNDSATPVTTNAALFSKEGLSKVLLEFDSRVSERASILQGGPRISDPSL